MVAKYAGKCAHCQKPFPAGAEVTWHGETKTATHKACGLGERGDGTFAVARETARTPAATPKPEPLPTTNGGSWSRLLVHQTNLLTDCYAASLKHAAQFGDSVDGEAVRALLITAYIQISRAGGLQ